MRFKEETHEGFVGYLTLGQYAVRADIRLHSISINEADQLKETIAEKTRQEGYEVRHGKKRFAIVPLKFPLHVMKDVVDQHFEKKQLK